MLDDAETIERFKLIVKEPNSSEPRLTVQIRIEIHWSNSVPQMV
jgi:hypothetical protein